MVTTRQAARKFRCPTPRIFLVDGEEKRNGDGAGASGKVMACQSTIWYVDNLTRGSSHFLDVSLSN
jgi:hypothetical protein